MINTELTGDKPEIKVEASSDLSEADLKKLTDANALSVIKNKVPLNIASKIGLKSPNEGINIISSIIGNTDNSDFNNLSYETLVDSFPGLSAIEKSKSENYVKAPTKFGSKPLSAFKEISDRARLYRKDSKDLYNIENYLKQAKDLHSSINSELSPEGFVDLIKVCLPAYAIKLFAAITTRESFTIQDLFEDLSCKYGTIKSRNELISEVYSNNDKNISLWDYLEKLMTIIDSSGSNYEMISQLAKNEFLNRVCISQGIATKNMIIQSLNLGKRDDFRSLYKLIKENYLPEFKNQSIRKMHNITVEKTNNNNLENKIKCYNCNNFGHFAKNCPQKNNRNRPNNTKNQMNRPAPANSYARAICSIHKSGHKNEDCVKQKEKCSFKPTHNTHQAGQCHRPANADNQNKVNEINNPLDSDSD